MARTQLSTREIGSIQRNDVDITTTSEALIRKAIAGSNISFSSTGVDAGTGDVTINAGVSGNFQLGSSSAISSAYHNGSISFHDDTTQNAVRFTPGNTEGSYWKTFESGSGTSTILNFQFLPRATGATYNGTTRFDSYGSNMALGVTGNDALRITGSGFIGIGHTDFGNISSPLDIISTTSQVKVRYDLDNYLGITVGPNGSTIFGIATPSGNPAFTFERVIKSTLTGSGAPAIDFASSDSYIFARVITNKTGVTDKHLYLNYDAGATSQVKIFSNNTEVGTFSGGNLLTITGGLTVTGDYLSSGNINLPVGTVTAANFSALTGVIEIANHVYGSDWDSNNSAPTKNAVYDKIQSLLASNTLTDGATVTINTTLANSFYHSGGTARTFALSGTPEVGRRYVLAMKNTGGSPITHTFTAAASSWRYGTDITAVSQIAAGETNYITFVYHPADGRYDIVAEVKGF